MRWVTLYSLLIAMLLSILLPMSMVTAAQDELVFIAKNDELLSFTEALQADIGWSPLSQLVTVSKDGKSVMLNVPKKQLYTDQELYEKYQQQINAEKARIAEEEARQRAAEEARKRAEQEQQNRPSGKEVYLTFDDGPNEYTWRILNLLEANRAQATFFMLKGQIESYPGHVKRMHQSGHGLGLHGVTHNASKIYRSPQTVVGEMEACNTALQKVTGVRTAVMRVPYGSKPWMTKSYRDVTVAAGYHLWDWNVDSFDSRAAVVPADAIVSEVIRQVAGKQKAVVLFHDKKTTLEALPRVLAYLKQNNYAFKPITSNMAPMNFWGDER